MPKKLLITIFLCIISISILFVGCEKKFNDVVNVPLPNYSVEGVSNFSSFTYSAADSTIILYLKIDSTSDVNEVYCSVYDPDGNELSNSPVQLLDNGDLSNGDATKGDGVYSNKFQMSHSDPVGKYAVKYFIKDNGDNTSLAAVQYFTYDNHQVNKPPVISDLVAPDTVTVTDTMSIFMSVKASDPNGLSDIQSVYFITYKPNGTTNGTQFEMKDDGNTSADGDVKAGDGIYSIIINVTYQNPKGSYRFDFEAEDRSGSISNVISHNIVIN